MGAASKLLLPLLYHGRPSPIPRLLLRSTLSALTLPFLPMPTFSSPHLQLGRRFFPLSNSSQQQHHYIHTTTLPIGHNFHSHHSSTFSEWSNLLHTLTHAGYFHNQPLSMQLIGDDALSAVENVPQDFVRAASACLSFARRHPHLLLTLSRKDIEIIVQNGSPFLFKCAMDSTKRMRSFLGGTQNNELVFEGADLGDLMRFLLSYVYDSVVSDQNNLASGELVESSVCSLLRQLACESRHIQEPALSSSVPNQLPGEYGQASRPLRQNIEMKPGDWICPKCMFMNFARNMKCLECDETRPKRQLTGGEWDCPQCNFFNYGRNVACLRCDCKRPGEAFGSGAPSFHSGYSSGNKADAFNRTAAPLEQRRTNVQYQGNLGNAGTSEHRNFESINGAVPSKSSGVAVNQSLDRILGRTSEGSKSEYVSSNPLPSETFIKSEQVTNNNSVAATGFSHLSPSGSSDGLPHSRKPVNEIQNKEDEGQAEKTERWFKKIEELDDIATNLPSAISEEDFPEIMPMRKGENRFVVSKKRDRPVTSPLHKRQMVMKQTNDGTNFVPFVPFPPDYFAKKDKIPESEASPGIAISGTSAFAKPELQGEMGRFGEQNSRVLDSGAFVNSVQSPENQGSVKEGMDTSFPGNTYSESSVNYSYQMPSGNSTEAANNVWTGSRQNGNSSSWEENRSSSMSPTGNSTQQSVNTNNTTESWRGGFSGMSLEGSLVKEPDPLDMSEEAKAERWFRRAAQIKDISELSQIPDEDFPQIMPMRKGVNRFVVSKRKTPLERRLTSPQYRRNLPTVSSDPTKKENTES